MKLIQLNMWEGRLHRNLLQFLALQQPDIICLQELQDFEEGGTALADLQHVTGLAHAYYAPLLQYIHYGISCFWGNCIISRYPFLHQEAPFVHGAFTTNWKHGDDFNKRNVQRVTVDTPQGRFDILNHHGIHVPSSKLGNEATMSVMAQIQTMIAQSDNPSILCGDFNLTPDSPSLATLNATMQNLVVDYNIANTRNFTAKRPVEVIDYIYVSKGVPVKSFTVPDDVVSDHQALVLEL